MAKSAYQVKKSHPLWRLVKATHLVRSRAYRERLRDRPLKTQPPADVLSGGWRKHFNVKRRSSITLWDVVQRYCDTVLHKVKTPNRYRAERNGLLRMADYFGRETKITRITLETLVTYRDTLLASGQKPLSANRQLSRVHVLLTICRDIWGIIHHVPRLRPLREPHRKYRFLSEVEEKRLLKHCPLHLWRLVVFLLGTGMRKSEALFLKWEDVYFADEGKRGRAWARVLNTKSGNPHGVPLPKHVTSILLEMRREKVADMEYVFTFLPTRDSRRDDGQLFLRKHSPAHYCYPDLDFREARKKAELPDVTIHTLRHTYASRLISKGVPIFDVARLLNHAHLSSTMGYVHLAPQYLERSVKCLDGYKPAHKPKRDTMRAR